MKFPHLGVSQKITGGPAEPEVMRSLANTYWRALMVAALVIAIGSVAFGVWELQNVSAVMQSIEQAKAPPVPPLDRGQLDATVSGFSTRESRYEALKTQPPVVPDPSH